MLMPSPSAETASPGSRRRSCGGIFIVATLTAGRRAGRDHRTAGGRRLFDGLPDGMVVRGLGERVRRWRRTPDPGGGAIQHGGQGDLVVVETLSHVRVPVEHVVAECDMDGVVARLARLMAEMLANEGGIVAHLAAACPHHE